MRVPDHPGYFRLVFLAILVLTTFLIVAQIGMAVFWLEPTPLQQNASACVADGWKTGFGAMVGWLAGKAL